MESVTNGLPAGDLGERSTNDIGEVERRRLNGILHQVLESMQAPMSVGTDKSLNAVSIFPTAASIDDWHPPKEALERLHAVLDALMLQPRPYRMTDQQHRNLVRESLHALFETEGFTVQGFADEPLQHIEWYEKVSKIDPSLAVKLGVHYFLYGGSIYKLGTEVHQKMLPAINAGRQLGCFAMTELGRGSDLRNLETTGTYNPKSDTFTIHSPTDTSMKFWIGGAARDARWAVVFGKLHVGGKDHGVHAWNLRIRHDDGTPVSGVTLGDCGAKRGLHGVDNGWIRFTHLQVDRSALLNRFADIDPQGNYFKKIQGSVFGKTIAALVTGRQNVSTGAALCARVACKLGYHGRVHRDILIPLIVKAYGATLARTLAAKHVHDHRIVSGLKAWITDNNLQTLMQVRQWMPQGVKTDDSQLFHPMAIQTVLKKAYDDSDIFVTFEGDNTVLYQHYEGEMLKELGQVLVTPMVGTPALVAKISGVLARHVWAGWSQTQNATERRILSERLSMAAWLAVKCHPALKGWVPRMAPMEAWNARMVESVSRSKKAIALEISKLFNPKYHINSMLHEAFVLLAVEGQTVSSSQRLKELVNSLDEVLPGLVQGLDVDDSYLQSLMPPLNLPGEKPETGDRLQETMNCIKEQRQPSDVVSEVWKQMLSQKTLGSPFSKL